MTSESIIDTLLELENKHNLHIHIKELGLSNRVRHSLLRERIATIGSLINQWNTILGIQNLGPKGRMEILEKLNSWYLAAEQLSFQDAPSMQHDLTIDEESSTASQEIDPAHPGMTFAPAVAVPALTSTQLELSIALNGYTYCCTLMRERGKLMIQHGTEKEMITITAKGLKLRGSDDEVEEGIELNDHGEQFAHYFVAPWNLTCLLRKQEDLVHVDLYQGRHDLHLVTLRLA
jgi:hypothetical protein